MESLKYSIHTFWLVLSYDQYGGQMFKMTLLTFCFVSLWNTWKTKIIIDSKLPCICSHLFNNFSQKTPKYLWEKLGCGPVSYFCDLTALYHFVICDWQYWSWGVLSKINRHVCHIHNSQDIVFDIFHTMSLWWHAIGTDYPYWQNCEHFL